MGIKQDCLAGLRALNRPDHTAIFINGDPVKTEHGHFVTHTHRHVRLFTTQARRLHQRLGKGNQFFLIHLSLLYDYDRIARNSKFTSVTFSH